MKKRIAVGCDPNAADLKRILVDDLRSAGCEVTDYGSEDAIYANVAIEVAEGVAAGRHDRGLLVCGTGIGMSISANKVKGAYAALVSDAYSAERSVMSNNANIMCMGAFTVGREVARKCLQVWLDAEFDQESRSAPKVQRYRDYDQAR